MMLVSMNDAGAVDRPIDMRLGGQIQHRIRTRLAKHLRHRAAIGDVRLHEGHPRVFQGGLEVQQAAGVGQLVDDHQAVVGVIEQVLNQIGPDETGAAGDEKGAH